MIEGKFVGPHGHDYQGLRDCLSSFVGERVVFVHNPGNAGDNVINLGTYRFFERMGLQYECGTNDQVYPDRVIVYSGGGALVPHYTGSDIFFRRNHSTCKAMILLPHTVRTYADLISEMDERCHLFVREAPSYDFVAKHITRANLYKSHDMAFVLDDAYIESLRWEVLALFRKRLLRSWIIMIIKFKTMAKLKDGTLHGFRTDLEGNSAPTNPLNIDMSMMFATGDMHFAHCANAAKALSAVLQAFRHIRTDRLHIAILSTILGLDVEMHDNNYGKNSDIFDYSIKAYFKNTRFTQRRHNLSKDNPERGDG